MPALNAEPAKIGRYALCRNCSKMIVNINNYDPVTDIWVHIHNGGRECFHPDSHKTDGSIQIGE